MYIRIKFKRYYILFLASHSCIPRALDAWPHHHDRHESWHFFGQFSRLEYYDSYFKPSSSSSCGSVTTDNIWLQSIHHLSGKLHSFVPVFCSQEFDRNYNTWMQLLLGTPFRSLLFSASIWFCGHRCPNRRGLFLENWSVGTRCLMHFPQFLCRTSLQCSTESSRT